MLFNSWEFLVFFIVVFGLYRSVGLRAQNILLLCSSYVFYGWWDWRFLGLLLVSTVVDFVVSNRMSGAGPVGRLRLLWVSLATNLGILGFFKYFNFFVDSAVAMAASVGIELSGTTLNIILPVGISFYTFQTMAYSIDVYRGRMQPCRDPIAFGVYVSYFPQLVAGPIERAQALIPQFVKKREVSREQLASGALLVLIGFVRKLAIADAIGKQVDEIFANPEAASSATLFRGAILFGIQIYGDFAGYSDMARGLSRMLGIELMENFNHPYFARNITIFWRRWHISLSTWLRDYLYIPLGGNRGSELSTYRNLMLTMLLGGLWHGASWNFVVWGGIHGVALAVHKLFVRGRDAPRVERSIGRMLVSVISWALTMTVVGLAWVFFRAPDMATALEIIGGISEFRGALGIAEWKDAFGFIALLLLIDVPQYLRANHTVFLRWPWLLRTLLYLVFILALLILAPTEETPFLYFQF